MEKTYLMETQGIGCSWTGSPGRRSQGKVWGGGSVSKYLPCKHKNLNFDLSILEFTNRSWCGRGRKVPETHWSAKLPPLVCSKVCERVCLRKQGRKY